MPKRKQKPKLSRAERNKENQVKQYQAVNDYVVDYYAKKAEEVKKLIDPNTLRNRFTDNTYRKSDLRTYLEAPSSNAKNLRALSRYLRQRSPVYDKLIRNNANMIDTNYRQIIPYANLLNIKDNEEKQFKKIRKSFYETSEMVDKMNLPSEMLKVYLECWTVDTFFGVYYYFDDLGGVMFPLDPDYCVITGQYPTGDFAFQLDCTWLNSYKDFVELWGEPFVSMYRTYQQDTRANRWQPVPDEFACCMKINFEDWKLSLPPYLPLFNSLINLEDLKDLQALQEESNVYKLLLFRMDTRANADYPDDFKVDPATSVAYHQLINAAVPDYVNTALTPLPVDVVTFSTDAATDTDKVGNSYKNILKTAGFSVTSEPEGATAITAALRADEDYAISSLLPQTQSWVNRILSYYIKDPAKVKFLEVTKYTKDEYKESLYKDMNYGLPMMTALGALNGFSELEMLRLAYLNEAVDTRAFFYPYATAATQSAHTPESVINGERSTDSSPMDKSDSGEESADKRESAG